jgi:hypothetical protein
MDFNHGNNKFMIKIATKHGKKFYQVYKLRGCVSQEGI